MLGEREHASRLCERSASEGACPGVEILENEAVELLEMAQIVLTFHPELGELCKAQRTRLCLQFGERARVCQGSEVAQHGRAGVNVRISHYAGRRPPLAPC